MNEEVALVAIYTLSKRVEVTVCKSFEKAQGLLVELYDDAMVNDKAEIREDETFLNSAHTYAVITYCTEQVELHIVNVTHH
jgi:hypothetical protein